MKVNFASNVSFQRALTTKEKKDYKNVCNKARSELGVSETMANIFDFNMPSKMKMNYGIGTMNSTTANGFINFIQDMSGISKILAGPQTELAYVSNKGTCFPETSPYSGSSYTLGAHTISLDKLTSKEYASILDQNYLKQLDNKYPDSKLTRSYRVDYGYVFGNNKDGVLHKSLDIAYKNYLAKIMDNDSDALRLQSQFEDFKKNLSNEEEKNIIFEAIAEEYRKNGEEGYDISSWNIRDRYLYSNSMPASIRSERIKGLNSQAEKLKFYYFLAEKQHMETKALLNKKGIKLFGDCHICFSPKEVWGNPDCFQKGWYTGVIDPNCPETNGIQGWGTPALNYDNLGEFGEKGEIINLGSTGKLLYEKFKKFSKLYDGMRMDAFWQYVTPFMYNSRYEGKSNGDLGLKITKIMEKASIDAKGTFSPDDYYLELIGYGTDVAKKLTKNIYPHTYSTAYAEYNENPRDLRNNLGYIDGKFTIGATCHDNDSLVNISRNKERRERHTPILQKTLKKGMEHLKYNSASYRQKNPLEQEEEDFRTAKIAEIFTTKNQYFTLPDMYGMSERINNTGKQDINNWTVRIPEDYEKFYFSQLANGYGINFPKAYEVALYSKNSQDKELISKLHRYSEILAADGPMTTKEADTLLASGKLNKNA